MGFARLLHACLAEFFARVFGARSTASGGQADQQKAQTHSLNQAHLSPWAGPRQAGSSSRHGVGVRSRLRCADRSSRGMARGVGKGAFFAHFDLRGGGSGRFRLARSQKLTLLRNIDHFPRRVWHWRQVVFRLCLGTDGLTLLNWAKWVDLEGKQSAIL